MPKTKITQEDLDDLVHDVFSQRASNLNNEGPVAQLLFLFEVGVLKRKVDEYEVVTDA